MDHRLETGTVAADSTAAHHRRRGMAQEDTSNSADYTGMEKDGIIRDSADDHHHHHATAGIQESHTRSILKGLTWRVLATSTVR